MGENETIIKCVAVGDGFVGKTCLLARLSKNNNIETIYNPTIFDNSSVIVTHNGKTYDIHLIDTAGQEEYSHLRVQAYTDVNVFLVCFSVTNMDSFTNIKQKWLPEIRKHSETSEIILVGTKSDLRNDPETIDRMNISKELFVSKSVAEDFAKDEKFKYMECSAVTEENISQIRTAVIEEYCAQQKSNLQEICIFNPLCKLINKAFCCKKYLYSH